mgnify:CR=1 FL=1
MNFPDEPVFHFLYWVINTPPIGGIIVMLLTGILLISVATTLFWVARGAQVAEEDVYIFPTETLLEEKDESQKH